MNPLDEYPEIRKYAYMVQWVVNLLLGIISIVLVAMGENPQWWIIIQAVFNFLWTYLGLTAKANVDTFAGYPADEFEDEGLDDDEAAAIQAEIDSNRR